MAGGFSIKLENLEMFKKFIFRRFENINIDSFKRQTLYIDSVISPTAMNLEFYSKVNSSSPFGSGNPEPKFIIENVKSINSKILKEKHIKLAPWVKKGSQLKL